MKTAILIVAYGASNPYGRTGLASFEAECRRRFAGLPVRWAFTSPALRERLALQKMKSDSVAKALLRLSLENFTAVAVQPLQMIPGREYEDVCATVRKTKEETGLKCAVGRPLLDAEPEPVVSSLLAHIPEERGPQEDVIFMGHGAKHPSEIMYQALSERLTQADPHVFIGTMSGRSGLEALVPSLSSKTVWLLPLLSCVGQHALQDMAGSGAGSWRMRLEQAGHICQPVLKGLAESPRLAATWLDHLAGAINQLA